MEIKKWEFEKLIWRVGFEFFILKFILCYAFFVKLIVKNKGQRPKIYECTSMEKIDRLNIKPGSL